MANNILLAIQAVICVLIIISIIMQQRGTALGSAFGSEGGSYSTRRGIQKNLLWLTIVLVIAFLGLAVILI
jgi:protein translocase SecG subunit